MGLHRPVILEILANAAERAGVTIRRGVTAESIDPSGDASHILFTDGTEGHYDLIVGADGVSSRTRRTLFPDAAKPRPCRPAEHPLHGAGGAHTG